MRERILLFLRSSFGYIGLIALAAYFAVLAGQSMFESYRAQEEVAALQRTLTEREQERDRLQALLAYYQTDNYKEKELRRALLLKQPNERVYALPESSVGLKREAESLAVAAPVRNTDPYWKQWAGYLFKGKRA